MMETATVQFRGQPREVEFYYEGDGVIVWSFTGEDVCFGGDNTNDDDLQAVHEQLCPFVEALS